MISSQQALSKAEPHNSSPTTPPAVEAAPPPAAQAAPPATLPSPILAPSTVLSELPEWIDFETIADTKTDGVAHTDPKGAPVAWDTMEHKDLANFAMHRILNDAKANSNPDFKAVHDGFKAVFNGASESKKIHNPFNSDGRAEAPIQIYKVKVTDTVSLSPGEIVALAGDFYGVVNKPISFGKDEEKATRFNNAYEQLFNGKPESESLKQFVKHIHDEAEANEEHANWKVRLKHQVMNTQLPIANVSPMDVQYAYAGIADDPHKHFWHSPYFSLSIQNFDHFGKDARAAYLAGHLIATDLMKKVKNEQNEKLKAQYIKEAFQKEFFAWHFLTDLFAGGHVRTPRREILNSLLATKTAEEKNLKLSERIPDLSKISSMDLTIAGFFAKKMHDRDGKEGVCVNSKKLSHAAFRDQANHGKFWVAKGDGNFYAKDNLLNAQMACEMLRIAFDDLVLAYGGKDILLCNDKALLEYVPYVDIEANKKTNRSPLFYYNEATDSVECSETITDAIKHKDPKAVIQGIKCASDQVPYLLTRFFKVTVAPTVSAAGSKVVADVKKGMHNLKELTVSELQNLKDKYEALKGNCKIM